jgi:hypothetical protein
MRRAHAAGVDVALRWLHGAGLCCQAGFSPSSVLWVPAIPVRASLLCLAAPLCNTRKNGLILPTNNQNLSFAALKDTEQQQTTSGA